MADPNPQNHTYSQNSFHISRLSNTTKKAIGYVNCWYFSVPHNGCVTHLQLNNLRAVCKSRVVAVSVYRGISKSWPALFWLFDIIQIGTDILFKTYDDICNAKQYLSIPKDLVCSTYLEQNKFCVLISCKTRRDINCQKWCKSPSFQINFHHYVNRQSLRYISCLIIITKQCTY